MGNQYIDINGNKVQSKVRAEILKEQVSRGVKECSLCKEIKTLDNFYKSHRTSYGYLPACILCNKNKKLDPETKQKTYQTAKVWKKNNREKYLQCRKDYRIKNKEKLRKVENERCKQKRKEGYYIGKDAIRTRKYRERNPWLDKMRRIIARFINITGTSKVKTTQEELGYTFQEFKLKFPIIDKEQSIDHKIPLSWFKNDTSAKIVNHLDNLQQISKSENFSKNNKYCSPISDDFYRIACAYIKEEYRDKIVLE